MKPSLIKGIGVEHKEFGANRVQDLFTNNPDLSIAVVEKIEESKLTKNPEHDIYFYVLKGETNSLLDGEKIHLQQGDLLIVPKGTPYKNGKGVTLLSITTPKFDRSKTVYLE